MTAEKWILEVPRHARVLICAGHGQLSSELGPKCGGFLQS